MTDMQKSADDIRNAVAETLRQAKAATDNYFDMIEKGLASTSLPLGDPTKPFRDLLRQNIHSGFDLSDKLLQAKDVQEVVRIQSEFFQNQLRTMTDQASTLGQTAIKAASGAFKMPQGS